MIQGAREFIGPDILQNLQVTILQLTYAYVRATYFFSIVTLWLSFGDAVIAELSFSGILDYIYVPFFVFFTALSVIITFTN